MQRRMWQPQQIVRTPRAGAAPTGRMPPVLDVPFGELARRREQEMLPAQPRIAVHERHHVLELIAKPERSAWLVEPRSRKQPGADILVLEPAIHQEVERIVWRL